jgi:hypothetical protein
MKIRRDIRIQKSLGVLSEYAERNFFFMLEHYKKLFLFGFRSKSSPSLQFLKYCPFKSCEEKKFHSEYSKFLGAVSKYAEWNLSHADNTRNEIHHILIIRGMKFSAHL